MGTPSKELTRLRGRIGKAESGWSDGGKQLIGVAGEFLTENLLDELELAWIKTVQHQNVYSSQLRDKIKASRPDYLVKIDDVNFFLDAKNLSRTTDSNGVIGFSIGLGERDRLLNAQSYFGLTVVLLIWDRSDIAFTYAFADPASFNVEKRIGGRQCVEAIFQPGDFVSHSLL